MIPAWDIILQTSNSLDSDQLEKNTNIEVDPKNRVIQVVILVMQRYFFLT